MGKNPVFFPKKPGTRVFFLKNPARAGRYPGTRAATHDNPVCRTYEPVLSAIWVLVARWLERLIGDQKVAGSISISGFLSLQYKAINLLLSDQAASQFNIILIF